jgi:hypothetical protein
MNFPYPASVDRGRIFSPLDLQRLAGAVKATIRHC